MNEQLLNIQSNVRKSSIPSTREESLRSLWSDTCYPVNQATHLPVAIAMALGGTVSLQERMLSDINEFVAKLTISDYLDAIHVELTPNVRDTDFQFTLSVTEPSDGFKKTARRWFDYRLPAMDHEGRSEIVNALIFCFLNRDTIGLKRQTAGWHQGSQLDIRTHKPSSMSQLRRDMDQLLMEGGRVSLQRVHLTLRARRQTGEFFNKYGELQNYSLQG